MLRGAALGDELLKDSDGLIGADAAVDVHREGFPGELVNDVEQLEHAPVGGLVELEVKRPHLTGPLRLKPAFRRGRGAGPGTLPRAARDAQALLAPQPLHPLAVHAPALLEQMIVRAPVAPTRPLRGERAKQPAQRLIVARADRLTALGGTVLTDDPAGPALADRQAVAGHRDRRPPAGWAHQFPRATSFKARHSSAWSATIAFKRWFSRSSSLRRLASSAFIPPYWLRHR